MTPYMFSKLGPNPTHSTRGLVKYVPGRGYFRAVPSQNGDKFVTSPTPSIGERVESVHYYGGFLLDIRPFIGITTSFGEECNARFCGR